MLSPLSLKKKITSSSKLLVIVPILISLSQLHAGENVNLAQKAEVSGSRCYSRNYQVHYAVDGDVPRLECKNDERQAWSVKGADGMFGEFTLTWKKPVEIAEVVYFGRTGQIIQDCFKDYEIYLDDNTSPVASGAFEMRHGPQRVAIKKTFAKKLRIRFKSAHKGAVNPGASEIAVFGSSTSDAQLRRVMLDNVGARQRAKGSFFATLCPVP
jgi:hypothetical protein